MKYQSRAVALSYIKHGESSIIAKIFTEEKGLQSFIIKGVRSKKSKKKLGYFQALQLSTINANFQVKKNLQYLIDINLFNPSNLQELNMPKKFISIFIAEVLSKVLQEGGKDAALFQFVWDLKTNLDQSENINTNLPIIFLLDLSKFLGFLPFNKQNDNGYFDLEAGEFTSNNISLKHYINKENSFYLRELLNKKDVSIPYINRNSILLHLIDYYKLQHHELKNMTSHLIIESLRS